MYLKPVMSDFLVEFSGLTAQIFAAILNQSALPQPARSGARWELRCDFLVAIKSLPLAREFHDSCARLLQTGLGLLQVCASLNSSAQSSDKRTFTYCWGRHLVHPLPLLLSRVPVASR